MSKNTFRIDDEQLQERVEQNIGKRGLKIKRHFTKDTEDPYAGINFTKVDSRIVNTDGSIVFELKDVEVPSNWSQVATDVMAQKYFRKRGVPQYDSKGKLKTDKNGNAVLGSETSAKQAIDRLAETWRYWGEQYGYFNRRTDADAFEDEIKYMLIRQMCSPNSPQWFNTGLHFKYGITGGAQGHYYVDPDTKELMKSADAYSRPQPHACFIQSVSDDLVNEGGIFDTVTKEARLFKFGSGTGTNFSTLRGGGEMLSGGGQSSGLMSFLKVFDAAAGSIKSGGTTRRAAKMVCLNIDHPEIEKFINWKVIEEQKVASLVAGSQLVYEHLQGIMASAERGGIDAERNPELKKLVQAAGASHVPLSYIKRVLMLISDGMKAKDFTFETYDTDFRSEAYNTVSGQNSNNSVRITNDFMQAIEEDLDWKLINRTDGKVNKTVKARKLWRDIVNAAWNSADPGLQYDTTINEWHTCAADGRINASNPCSEYMFLDNTACNLASLNLVKFYSDTTGEFDIESYRHAIRLWTVVLEISVLMSQLPSQDIALLTYKYRTLGLGYANLGSLLMRQGIAYDSEDGFAITGALTAIMTGEAYATSAEMASVLGTFERYDANKEHMLRVMRNHRRAAYDTARDEYEGLTIFPMGISPRYAPSNMLQAAQESWDYALLLGEQFGYRNAQTTVIAPTGTIGLVMDCDTTGIEPDFALVKFKKLVGGGYFKIVNQSVEPALVKLGYTQEQITDILNYVIGTHTLKNAPYINDKRLSALGFGEEQLNAIEGMLPAIFDVRSAFTRWSLGEEFLTNTLGISTEKLNAAGFDLLTHLGFNGEEIAAANEYICGTMMIEGAPHLKVEHLPVFDCANKCGANGQRYISSLGHIKQMAAAQPFLSGAISKTINLPEEAKLSDIDNAYKVGWELMLKANALYRDGSKLSQPLNTGNVDSAFAKLFIFDEEDQIDEQVSHKELHEVITATYTQPLRRRLPDERHSITHKFSVSGHQGFITVGLYENGAPGEVFVTMDKEGSTLSGIMDALTYTISIALQYGVPLESVIKKFVHTRFEPAGITENSEIPMVTSLIDYIGRYLAVKFLPKERAVMYHNEELINRSYTGGSNYRVLIPVINGKGHSEIKYNREEQLKIIAEQLNGGGVSQQTSYIEPQVAAQTVVLQTASTVSHKSSTAASVAGDVKHSSSSLQTGGGNSCTVCGGMMKRSGSCEVCTSCGTTTGCS